MSVWFLLEVALVLLVVLPVAWWLETHHGARFNVVARWLQME